MTQKHNRTRYPKMDAETERLLMQTNQDEDDLPNSVPDLKERAILGNRFGYMGTKIKILKNDL